ncbi:hypothetical protein DFH28DRAFT_248459 [Melampsora americana]|nr:hypothetical protein DFH28DRAFT_248459 [Melampsora americana]
MSRTPYAYLFMVPLALQAWYRHPYYMTSKAASRIRAMLMPATIYLALSSNRARHFEPRDTKFHINVTIASFLTVHIVCLAIQLGLSQAPPLPVPNDHKSEEKVKTEIPQKSTSSNENIPAPSWGELIKYTVWLLTSLRFIQTTWAPPKSVVPPAPKLRLKEFLIMTIKKTLKHHLLFLLCWIVGVTLTQHAQGCYGFLTQEFRVPESQWLKIIAPYFNAIPYAFATWLTVENMANWATLVELAVYYFGPRILPKTLAPGPFDSTLYPPIYPDLWGQSSIAQFWSKGWHAALRRDITFCVGAPIGRVFSPFGRSLSTFAANTCAMLFSAFFHEYVVISSAPAPDPTYGTAKCWIHSAVAIGFEYMFTIVTGKRVGGVSGKIWTYSVVFLLQLHSTTKWLEFGLGQVGIIPVSHWTWHRYVIPFGPVLPESWIS